jgi:hypothetical protein
MNGLARVPEADLVTVAEANPAFVEAFLAGLNHEMYRELLWRGYPAGRPGTSFHRFWSDRDEISDLALFEPAPLGDHVRGATAAPLVLAVRGELIRRHPDLFALALRAERTDPAGRPVFGAGGAVAPIVFQRLPEPDLLLVGFALPAEEVRRVREQQPETRWWFLLGEHPCAPRFGPDPVPPGGFLGVADGDASSTAVRLLRDPVRAAFDVWSLIRPTERSERQGDVDEHS